MSKGSSSAWRKSPRDGSVMVMVELVAGAVIDARGWVSWWQVSKDPGQC
jgi:hypothetical protein